MEKLKKSIALLVSEELARANAKFPQFASAHEGYAVLLEEYQETGDELERVRIHLEGIWHCVKNNSIQDCTLGSLLKSLKEYATLTACEATQTAAMAQKFMDMMEREGK